MKRNLLWLLLAAGLICMAGMSCNSEKSDDGLLFSLARPDIGSVQFAYSNGATGQSVQLKTALSFLQTDRSTASLSGMLANGVARFLLVSIEDTAGKKVYDMKTLPLYEFVQGSGNYITEPISLAMGSYMLTNFAVLDSQNTVIYATPVTGGALNYLVDRPLPIEFAIGKDEVKKLVPQVIAVAGGTAADFGFISFNFELVPRVNVLIAAFTHDNATTNYTYTAATITITDNAGKALYNGLLDTKVNNIVIRDNCISYLVTLNKPGYTAYTRTLTLDQMREYTTTPLNIIMLPDGSQAVVNLSYSSTPCVYTKDMTIASNVPTVSGLVTSWAVNPALPAGLTFDAATGIISGVPTNVQSASQYTVTASNDFSSSSAVISISVVTQGLAQWAQTLAAGSNKSAFNSVAAASDGSLYAAGYIVGNAIVNFGNNVTATGTCPASGAGTGFNIVLVKYNAGGVAQWARTVTAGNNNSHLDKITIAPDGSLYAVGYIYGTGAFNFGNGVTAQGSADGWNSILVKYNTSGVAQWAQTVSGVSDRSFFNSVSVAPDGSVYAAGRIYGNGSCSFGNGVTATVSNASTLQCNNVVLVKYNGTGQAQWAKTVSVAKSGSSVNDSIFESVSAGPDGSVYAAGSIYGTAAYDFGNGVSATGKYTYTNNVLVKYNSSGTAQWAQTVAAGPGYTEFKGVSAAQDGSVYAVGFVAGGSYDFGNGVTAAGTFTPGWNAVLVKYSSSGAAQWIRTVTTAVDSSHFSSLYLASDGSIFVTGYIYNIHTYGFGNTVTAAGTNYKNSRHNAVIVKYNNSGTAQWARSVTAGDNDSEFNGVSVAPDGSVYAAGFMNGTSTYGFGNLISVVGPYAGAYAEPNALLVKYK